MLGSRAGIRAELSDTPEEAARLEQLEQVGAELQKVLVPWGSARDDWEYGVANLGASEGFLGSVGKALGSWHTLLPPVAARAMVEVLLEHGASAWALRTFQVGGDDPTIRALRANNLLSPVRTQLGRNFKKGFAGRASNSRRALQG